MGTLTPRGAAWCAGVVMLAVYAATLAPGVTFWDSGEFIAAARVFGIPHPPGTPLFVVALAAWTHLWPFLSFAAATNLFSAACTAGAVALTVLWLARTSGQPWAALAAGITAGAMGSVWANATETEVYAASLFACVAAIAAADLAGRTGDRRWLVLAAYGLALAVPLHLSILVCAPVVVYLVTDRQDGTRDWPAGLALLGASVSAAGIGRLSVTLTVIGLALIAVSAVLTVGAARRLPITTALQVAIVLAVALSGLAILLLRARQDPAINQANPSTLHALASVVGRRQYDVAGLWPRRAPPMIQIANWFEYADWQFALAFGPSVFPTVGRVIGTAVYACLGVLGAGDQYLHDRRSWRAVLLLFLCGSLGVIVYLNLKAGASFAWNLIPDDAGHEARDRDYFFVLGFWAWGIWAGMGAMWLARRLRGTTLPRGAGLGLAALPIVLNWGPNDRRHEPEASLPAEVAHALLDPLPARAVLFVAGDNDSYPLWYAQQVWRDRRDVTVVTMPLLNASWYAVELERRDRLVPQGWQPDVLALGRQIVAQAHAQGRPVAAALTVSAHDRNLLYAHWKVIGMDALAVTDSAGSMDTERSSGRPALAIDTVATRAEAARISAWRRNRTIEPALDGAPDYFFGLLSCPSRLVSPTQSRAELVSLDSLCSLR